MLNIFDLDECKIECTYMKLSIIIHPLFRFKLVTLLHGHKSLCQI